MISVLHNYVSFHFVIEIVFSEVKSLTIFWVGFVITLVILLLQYVAGAPCRSDRTCML